MVSKLGQTKTRNSAGRVARRVPGGRGRVNFGSLRRSAAALTLPEPKRTPRGAKLYRGTPRGTGALIAAVPAEYRSSGPFVAPRARTTAPGRLRSCRDRALADRP